jgi:predicted  nucleic acid-binding Zn-ribbon protein
LQLQRQALELANTQDTIRAIAQQNAYLEKEVENLRIIGDSERDAQSSRNGGTSSRHVSELTLALRRAQKRLTATEDLLLSRTKETADIRALNAQLEFRAIVEHKSLEEARQEAAAAKAAERDAQLALRQAIEERNMSDVVVHEYADLVKCLEGRTNASSTQNSTLTLSAPHSLPPLWQESAVGTAEPQISTLSYSPLRSMLEGRQGLQKLIEEMNTETNRLHAEMANLHVQLENLGTELYSRQSAENADREKLAIAQVELMRYQADDTAAAKLVSRYMLVSFICFERRAIIFDRQCSGRSLKPRRMSSKPPSFRQKLGMPRRSRPIILV